MDVVFVLLNRALIKETFVTLFVIPLGSRRAVLCYVLIIDSYEPSGRIWQPPGHQIGSELIQWRRNKLRAGLSIRTLITMTGYYLGHDMRGVANHHHAR